MSTQEEIGQAVGDSSFVFGSAVKHPYPLTLGYYSVHTSDEALARGDETHLLPVQRQFLYLPLEHSEDLADQERCVELMRGLEAYEETRGLTQWAEKHRVIIARFGRFPHRNAALGRSSTPEELEFLKQPGSGF